MKHVESEEEDCLPLSSSDEENCPQSRTTTCGECFRVLQNCIPRVTKLNRNVGPFLL